MGLEFSGTISRIDLLVDGAIATVWISAVAMVLSLIIGTAGALLMGLSRLTRYVMLGYVEIIRNTPVLVQIFFIYFGLPSIGLRLPPLASAIIGLSIYGGAYMTEILRAGIEQVPRGQIEAGRALGLRPWQVFTKIVLRPAVGSMYPALAGQFILLMQSSSLLSAISVTELTAAASDIQSLTARNFEAFILVAAFYLALTTGFRFAFGLFDRVAFSYKHVGK